MPGPGIHWKSMKLLILGLAVFLFALASATLFYLIANLANVSGLGYAVIFSQLAWCLLLYLLFRPSLTEYIATCILSIGAALFLWMLLEQCRVLYRLLILARKLAEFLA